MKEKILSKLKEEGFEPIKTKSKWDKNCGYEVVKEVKVDGQFGKITKTLKVGLQVKEDKIILATGYEENGKRHAYDPGHYSHDQETEFSVNTPLDKIIDYVKKI